MILIYTREITPRVAYIVRFIFTDILGCRYHLTSNDDEFRNWESTRINYSDAPLGGVTVKPHSLLIERGTHPFDVQISCMGDLPVLFPVKGGDLPFDIFSAAFYMISRYEEYLSPVTDNHGRVEASSSMAYRHGFLQIPVVDRWVLVFRDVIQKKYPAERFSGRSFRFIPTVDVDVAFAYKGRNYIRNAGAMAKALLSRDFKDARQRWQTWTGKMDDPFDTFPIFRMLHDAVSAEAVYFFLVGPRGRHDRNLSSSHPAMKTLIADTARENSVGIHPSYSSYLDSWKIQEEMNTLSGITGKPVTQSRQHYVRLKIPETYETLAKCGILEDYSMGYADDTGFRAGTCTPFHFYSLSREEEVGLTIYPFAVMDGTLNQYLKLTPQEALQKIAVLIAEVRKVQGTFISIWHNESLGNMNLWRGWNEIYALMVKMASE